MQATSLLALAERLKQHARKHRQSDLGADLRYAAFAARRLAALAVVDEAKATATDIDRQRLLDSHHKAPARLATSLPQRASHVFAAALAPARRAAGTDHYSLDWR